MFLEMRFFHQFVLFINILYYNKAIIYIKHKLIIKYTKNTWSGICFVLFVFNTCFELKLMARYFHRQKINRK